ncbi:MAG: hypothetical protein SPF17_02260 [Candidatus Mucispirillum faecigallinarum]|uniref:Uncharacterized protein n=1 Tax=Candidatus Mucispirillum faecigallinarum TaxID=2838699 RepID=A0A9D2GTE0_9BACT|nr:hypothetical protein [Mucispirillum sp.]MDY5050217.1 hypothetical protein [Candidatus Mucispirillum faecigallinarum]HIZ89683.1 hypothetical protein [Candidatus Mucispirillum faecigallinarum]
MITSLKYYPILIASIVMMASFLFKVLMVPDLKVTYFARDIILFFIVYYVVKVLTNSLARILKNYWKIL